MWQCWVAYLTSQGLSVQVVCMRARLTCVIPWGGLRGGGHQGHLEHILLFFFFPSFYNVEFKAVCIKDGFLKVFFIYENISKDMYIYSVRNNDKIIPLCAHYSA